MVHTRFPDNHVWDKGTVRALRLWVPPVHETVKVERSFDVAMTDMMTQVKGQYEQNARSFVSGWADELVAPDADMAKCRLFVLAYRCADSDHDSEEETKLRPSMEALKHGLSPQIVKCEESIVVLQGVSSEQDI